MSAGRQQRGGAAQDALEQVLGGHQGLNLTGALVNRQDQAVAQKTFDVIVLDHPVTAEGLHPRARHADRLLGAGVLDQRGHLAQVAAQPTLACLEHPDAVGQAFNIGNPRATVTIYDLALRIKRLTGADVDITFQPLHYADVELRIPNVEKAREVLGFAAKVDLDEGLEKTIAWYREKALSPSA